MFKINKIAFLIVACTCANLSAGDFFQNEINFVSGYRNDDLTRTNRLLLGSTNSSELEKISIKNIHLGQVGLDLRLRVPPLDLCYDGYDVLNHFYAKGHAHWGWGGCNANLNERTFSIEAGERQVNNGRIKNVNTADYQVGLGYIFEYCNWDLGLSVGYSYDMQRVNNNAQRAFSAMFPGGNALTSRTKFIWKGPWVGAEGMYQWDRWSFSAGYEYHFAEYIANQKIKNTGLSHDLIERTKCTDAFGNVVFLKTMYHFCNGWQVGLEFKYQNWQANKGRLNLVEGSFSNADLRVKASGKWVSSSLNAYVGYYF